MKTLTLIFFIILLVAILGVNESEGNLWKKITNPVKKAIKDVGKLGEKVGREIGNGVKNIGKAGEKVGGEIGKGFKHVGKELERGLKNSKKLVDNIVKKPLQELNKLTFPILSLLKKRKQIHHHNFDLSPPHHVEISLDNEPFDTKLLRLHNELRTETKSSQTLVMIPIALNFY